MPMHDDDNIPVLEDVIPEHEIQPATEPAADLKQKTLWDDDGNAQAQTPAAAAEPARYPAEPAPDEPGDDVTPTAGDASSPPLEQIDIDTLAGRILYQLMPGLEDYLLDRIRSALKTALDDKHRN